MSFKEDSYDFINNVPYLIQGINKTDEGTESNESGKSSLEEAMNYILIGSPIRKVRDIELIHRGDDSSVIEGIFVNSKDNTQLKIVRTLFQKKSAKLEVYLNDINQEFSSINTGNDLILSIIGISKDDIQNYFLINKEKYKSFFSSSDIDKKDLIARFSNVDKLDGIDKLIDIDITEFQNKFNSIVSNEQNIVGKIQVYQEEYDNFDNSIELNRNSSIQKIQNDIEECNQKISRKNLDIDNKNEYLLSINSIIDTYNSGKNLVSEELEKLQDIDFENDFNRLQKEEIKFNKEKGELKLSKDDLNKDLNDFKLFLNEVELSVRSSIKCPKCLHEFIVGKDIDIEEARKSIPEVKKSITDIESSIKAVNDNILTITQHLNKIDRERNDFNVELNKFRKHKRDLQAQIDKYDQDIEIQKNNIIKTNGQISTLKSEIDNLLLLIKSHEKSIQDIKNSNIKDKKKDLLIKIQEQQSILESLKSQKLDIEQKIQDLKVWQNTFKRFYSHLTNQSLTVIQGYSNLYLQRMGSNLQVRLEGYKLLSDGRLKENITASILRNGIVDGSFWSLSGGAKARMECALILAIQSLINITSKTGGLNLLFIDEILDSTDKVAMRAIIDSFENIKKTVILVTHISHEKVHTNSIVVEKVNGISKIVKS